MKKNNILFSSLFALSLLFISGCGTTYTFNNQSYDKAETALAAHGNFLNGIESKIQPVANKKGGKAVIITPSKKTNQTLGIQTTGAPTQEMLDYIASIMTNDYNKFAAYLTKANLFDSVEHYVDDHPKSRAKKEKSNFDTTIYLDIVSPTQISWFVISPADAEAKPIIVDSMAENGAPKVLSWLSSLEGAVSK